MKKFRLHWLHGEEEIVEGVDIADAFRRAGYGGGAIRAVDYFREIKEEKPATSTSPSPSSTTP
ncbi:MAG: hypothetical protein HYY92_00755 [Parcubacteria group bacterium]|nr:hypothetical protein [Parcubacteria group bacterium]